MTRRSDLMLEDLFGCDHSPTIPIIDEAGEIVLWKCTCGLSHPPVRKPEATVKADDEEQPR